MRAGAGSQERQAASDPDQQHGVGSATWACAVPERGQARQPPRGVGSATVRAPPARWQWRRMVGLTSEGSGSTVAIMALEGIGLTPFRLGCNPRCTRLLPSAVSHPPAHLARGISHRSSLPLAAGSAARRRHFAMEPIARCQLRRSTCLEKSRDRAASKARHRGVEVHRAEGYACLCAAMHWGGTLARRRGEHTAARGAIFYEQL